MTRSLVYYVAVSLDGRIAAPDGSFDAFPTEGDHFEVIFRDWRDTLPAPALDALGLTPVNDRFDTVLMGWNTYAVGLPALDSPYPHLQQIVFSRQDRSVPADVRLTAEDPVEVVRDLRTKPGGDLWLCGGGRLAGTLLGEIDRLVLKVNPVVLGDGIPLFGGVDHQVVGWELTASRSFASGVVITEYQRR